MLLFNVFLNVDSHVVFLSFVSSTANSSLLGGGGGKCVLSYYIFIVMSF